jgi:Flp pilus assembly pilin Flp
MNQRIRRVFGTDRGGSSAEYGIVAGLVAIAVIVVAVFAGNMMGQLFNYIGTQLNRAIPISTKIR